MDELLTAADREQIARLGIGEAEVRRQLELLNDPPPPVRLARPCAVGDGIVRIPAERFSELEALHAEAEAAGRFRKLVPASGAASRMFQSLTALLAEAPDISEEDARGRVARGDKRAADLTAFAEGVPRFAFRDDLAAALAAQGASLDALLAGGAWGRIARAMLETPGLGYAERPKGLIPFHRYGTDLRTPFEEHLVEAARTVRDRSGLCGVHFTVSAEHEEDFRALLARVQAPFERELGCALDVDFSNQSPSTDTVAIDAEGRPFRLSDGSLLFRPGGHGALIENLERLEGDLVYVKNIDNVLHGSQAGPTVVWKRRLSGYLLWLLREGAPPDRPVRVCGVVPNQGEPGGGPFWVTGRDGESPQIVESSQIDASDPAQKAVWAASTHFNPVDLVCSLRDPTGKPYRLADFVDPDTVFLSKKSKDGRTLTALERPGLWNGAMAGWHTVFVEVPIETFAPVKTVLDLLRPQHQEA